MLENALKLTALCVCFVLSGCSSSTMESKEAENTDVKSAYTKPRIMSNFDDYVQYLKRRAISEGVSKEIVNAQMNIRYIPKAVQLDRQQAGRKRSPSEPRVANPNGTTQYLNKVLTQAKVDKAGENYWNVSQQLEKASKKYGVQKQYLLALWGMESSFGYYQGSYDVLSVLATLAFDGRRETLFSKEFVAAMRLLERDHIQRYKMLGSWAGAMGQTQFMPSSYLSYAADGDGNGEKDIWQNHYDVFASIANYLSTVGWDDKLPWGVEVTLTEPMSLALSGIEKNKSKSLREWQSQGVVLKFNSQYELAKLNALSSADLWLVRPDKEVGRAFLVSNNFRTILDWNKSNYFAVSIGMFADRISQEIGVR